MYLYLYLYLSVMGTDLGMCLRAEEGERGAVNRHFKVVTRVKRQINLLILVQGGEVTVVTEL
jgi:hypothetical protein